MGPKTLATLKALGAERVGDLTRLDPEVLEEALGNHGLRIRELALGREDSVVRGAAHPKSLSREHTYDEPQVDLPELWEQLQLLAQLLQEGLAGQGLAGRRVTVKVRYADHQTTTRSATLQRPIATAADVYEHAVRLLERTHAGARPVRLLGISLSDLGAAPEDRQLELVAGPQ